MADPHPALKIRIGIGASAASLADLVPVLDGLTEFGFDSIWLPEVLTGQSFDPIVALTWAAARYPRCKLGTTMLLPGRNLVRLAKQLASLDLISNGRLLVTFVPGINVAPEGAAIGLPLAQRRAAMADALPVLRSLLAGTPTSHDGPAGSFADVTLSPLPVQQPLEFWLGGTAARSLELCGQYGDGWLPSMLSPEQAYAGRHLIDAAASDAGRAIDPEHFGVSIGYSREPLADDVRARLSARAKGADLAQLVPEGPEALRSLLTEYIGAGFSKFVVRPLGPVDWHRESGLLRHEIVDLQT